MIETKALIDRILHHKAPFPLSVPCNKLSYLPDSSSRCFLTGSSLQPEAWQIEQAQNGSLIHSHLPKQSPWIVINWALPQCPNSHGLWGGEVGAWHMIIYVLQHWDLTKLHNFCKETFPRLPKHPWPWWASLASAMGKAPVAFQMGEKHTHQSFFTNELHRSPRTAK